MRVRLAIGVVLACLAVVGAACENAPGRPDPADGYVRPADVLSFETLYATNCSGCHGADGVHGAAIALANPVYLAWAPAEAIREAVTHGVAGTPMPAFARSQGGWLTDAQIEVIVDGLRTAWGRADAVGAASLPPYHGRPGSPDRGAVAYERFCERCHGAGALGGDDGSAVAVPDYLALVSDQALRAAIVAGRPDLEMPDWRALGDKPMTGRQIDDVVSWLAARRPE